MSKTGLDEVKEELLLSNMKLIRYLVERRFSPISREIRALAGCSTGDLVNECVLKVWAESIPAWLENEGGHKLSTFVANGVKWALARVRHSLRSEQGQFECVLRNEDEFTSRWRHFVRVDVGVLFDERHDPPDEVREEIGIWKFIKQFKYEGDSRLGEREEFVLRMHRKGLAIPKITVAMGEVLGRKAYEEEIRDLLERAIRKTGGRLRKQSPFFSKREQQVIEMRFLRLPSLTFEQIGKRLGVTQERIRQVERKAIRKIQNLQNRPEAVEEYERWREISQEM